MWYRKFAVILLFICLVAADSAGVQKILQISKEKELLRNTKTLTQRSKKKWLIFRWAGVEMGWSKTVAYGDSFMMERTYGGKRGHEGCDIMASLQPLGAYIR